MRLSNVLLFNFLASTRSHKLNIVSKSPPSSLASMIACTVLAPTFLIPDRPNLIFPLDAVKPAILSLTSGASTSIPICLHSVMLEITLSVLPESTDRRAAINSAGKWAFKYAVW